MLEKHNADYSKDKVTIGFPLIAYISDAYSVMNVNIIKLLIYDSHFLWLFVIFSNYPVLYHTAVVVDSAGR